MGGNLCFDTSTPESRLFLIAGSGMAALLSCYRGAVTARLRAVLFRLPVRQTSSHHDCFFRFLSGVGCAVRVPRFCIGVFRNISRGPL